MTRASRNILAVILFLAPLFLSVNVSAATLYRVAVIEHAIDGCSKPVTTWTVFQFAKVYTGEALVQVREAGDLKYVTIRQAQGRAARKLGFGGLPITIRLLMCGEFPDFALLSATWQLGYDKEFLPHEPRPVGPPKHIRVTDGGTIPTKGLRLRSEIKVTDKEAETHVTVSVGAPLEIEIQNLESGERQIAVLVP